MELKHLKLGKEPKFLQEERNLLKKEEEATEPYELRIDIFTQPKGQGYGFADKEQKRIFDPAKVTKLMTRCRTMSQTPTWRKEKKAISTPFFKENRRLYSYSGELMPLGPEKGTEPGTVHFWKRMHSGKPLPSAAPGEYAKKFYEREAKERAKIETWRAEGQKARTARIEAGISERELYEARTRKEKPIETSEEFQRKTQIKIEKENPEASEQIKLAILAEKIPALKPQIKIAMKELNEEIQTRMKAYLRPRHFAANVVKEVWRAWVMRPREVAVESLYAISTILGKKLYPERWIGTPQMGKTFNELRKDPAAKTFVADNTLEERKLLITITKLTAGATTPEKVLGVTLGPTGILASPTVYKRAWSLYHSPEVEELANSKAWRDAANLIGGELFDPWNAVFFMRGGKLVKAGLRHLKILKPSKMVVAGEKYAKAEKLAKVFPAPKIPQKIIKLTPEIEFWKAYWKVPQTKSAEIFVGGLTHAETTVLKNLATAKVGLEIAVDEMIDPKSYGIVGKGLRWLFGRKELNVVKAGRVRESSAFFRLRGIYSKRYLTALAKTKQEIRRLLPFTVRKNPAAMQKLKTALSTYEIIDHKTMKIIPAHISALKSELGMTDDLIKKAIDLRKFTLADWKLNLKLNPKLKWKNWAYWPSKAESGVLGVPESFKMRPWWRKAGPTSEKLGVIDGIEYIGTREALLANWNGLKNAAKKVLPKIKTKYSSAITAGAPEDALRFKEAIGAITDIMSPSETVTPAKWITFFKKLGIPADRWQKFYKHMLINEDPAIAIIHGTDTPTRSALEGIYGFKPHGWADVFGKVHHANPAIIKSFAMSQKKGLLKTGTWISYFETGFRNRFWEAKYFLLIDKYTKGGYTLRRAHSRALYEAERLMGNIHVKYWASSRFDKVMKKLFPISWQFSSGNLKAMTMLGVRNPWAVSKVAGIIKSWDNSIQSRKYKNRIGDWIVDPMSFTSIKRYSVNPKIWFERHTDEEKSIMAQMFNYATLVGLHLDPVISMVLSRTKLIDDADWKSALPQVKLFENLMSRLTQKPFSFGEMAMNALHLPEKEYKHFRGTRPEKIFQWQVKNKMDEALMYGKPLSKMRAEEIVFNENLGRGMLAFFFHIHALPYSDAKEFRAVERDKYFKQFPKKKRIGKITSELKEQIGKSFGIKDPVKLEILAEMSLGPHLTAEKKAERRTWTGEEGKYPELFTIIEKKPSEMTPREKAQADISKQFKEYGRLLKTDAKTAALYKKHHPDLIAATTITKPRSEKISHEYVQGMRDDLWKAYPDGKPNAIRRWSEMSESKKTSWRSYWDELKHPDKYEWLDKGLEDRGLKERIKALTAQESDLQKIDAPLKIIKHYKNWDIEKLITSIAEVESSATKFFALQKDKPEKERLKFRGRETLEEIIKSNKELLREKRRLVHIENKVVKDWTPNRMITEFWKTDDPAIVEGIFEKMTPWFKTYGEIMNAYPEKEREPFRGIANFDEFKTKYQERITDLKEKKTTIEDAHKLERWSEANDKLKKIKNAPDLEALETAAKELPHDAREILEKPAGIVIRGIPVKPSDIEEAIQEQRTNILNSKWFNANDKLKKIKIAGTLEEVDAAAAELTEDERTIIEKPEGVKIKGRPVAPIGIQKEIDEQKAGILYGLWKDKDYSSKFYEENKMAEYEDTDLAKKTGWPGIYKNYKEKEYLDPIMKLGGEWYETVRDYNKEPTLAGAQKIINLAPKITDEIRKVWLEKRGFPLPTKKDIRTLGRIYKKLGLTKGRKKRKKVSGISLRRRPRTIGLGRATSGGVTPAYAQSSYVRTVQSWLKNPTLSALDLSLV